MRTLLLLSVSALLCLGLSGCGTYLSGASASVSELDGNPALTAGVSFAPNPKGFKK